MIDIIRRNKRKEQIFDQVSYNKGIRSAWIGLWSKNMAINYEFIRKRFEFENWDLHTYKQRNHIKDYAFILGSGPSLDKALPLLKDWEGDIYCSSSQLLSLAENGITPSACFMIDSDPNMSYLVKDVDTSEISLITNPCMDPEVLKAWQGPIYFFRMWDPGDPLFNEFCPAIYTNVNNKKAAELNKPFGVTSYVMNGGCVVNTMIAVIPQFGHKAVFLSGVDFGFPGGIRRATEYRILENKVITEPPKTINLENAPYEGSEKIRTDKVSIFYKYSTLQLYGLDQPCLISCSDGILKEVPYVHPEEVIAQQGDVLTPDLLDPEKRYLAAKEYLKYRKIIIVNNTYKGQRIKFVIHLQQLKPLKRLLFRIRYLWNTYIIRKW